MEVQNETKVGLLLALKAFTETAVEGLRLKVRRQKEDEEEPKPRPAAVYLMRLPDMSSVTKKAPYILHQVVTGHDAVETLDHRTGPQAIRERQSRCVVRTVLCVYDPDEQEGALTLLNLMEQLRMALLMKPILGGAFVLDEEEGLDGMVYLENGERTTAPYYLGEMVSVWKLPKVERLDAARVTHGYPARDPGVTSMTGTIPKK